MNYFQQLVEWVWPHQAEEPQKAVLPNKPFPLESLPNDVFGQLLLWLDPIVLGKLMQTSQSLKRRIESHTVWNTEYRRIFYFEPLPTCLYDCRQQLMKHWFCLMLSNQSFCDKKNNAMLLDYDCHDRRPFQKAYLGSICGRWKFCGKWKLFPQRHGHVILLDTEDIKGVYFPIVYDKGTVEPRGLDQLAFISW